VSQPPQPGRGGQIAAPPGGPGRSRGPPPPTGRPGPAAPAPAVGRARGHAPADVSISSTASASSVHTPTASDVRTRDSGGAATVAKSDGSGGSGVGRGRASARGATREQTYIYHTRPAQLTSKKGDGGTPFKCVTNYFRIDKRPGWNLLQHRVDFKPEEDETKFRKILVNSQRGTVFTKPFIFDGTMLFTTQRFEPPKVITCKNEKNGQVHEVTIRLVGEVSDKEYHYTQLMNILLRKTMEELKLVELGRNYYDPQAKTILKEFKLELWPGYVTSIRQHEGNMLFCCELSTKVLRTDTALDQLKIAHKDSRGNMAQLKTAAGRLLIGNIVITKYNNKTYRIDDIDWNKNPETRTFDYRGTEINLITYYQTKYNLKIEDKQQPLLVSNPTSKMKRSGMNDPIPLVPELCNMTGMSDDQRADFKLMKAVSGVTLAAPPKRVESLRKFSKRLADKQSITDEFKSWDLRFDPNLVTMDARTLPMEEICAGKGIKAQYQSADNADWSGMFRNFKLFNPISCTKWAVIFCERDKNDVLEFIKCLGQVSGKMGFTLGKPKDVPIGGPRTQEYMNQLKTILPLAPNLIMVVIPNNKSDVYAAVKKATLCQTPVPTQCMTATVLRKFASKGFSSVATKVAVQMACKLGAEPWAVKVPPNNRFMVIGYDTWHDASQKGLSIGAVVSTLNSTFTRFTSSCTLHRNNEENLDQMKTCIANALRKYFECNRALPEKVVIYRDGVGDGQIQLVREQEVSQIKSVLAEVKTKVAKDTGVDKEISLTYVIVSKRVNSRFFKAGKDFTNPPSGSVFDDVVTLPERYDFFLISQSVRQGTVNPTSYNVIEDTSNWPPKIVQSLTYKLTHLYYNWPGTVRVPMVCQYAHKLAYLVGQSVHQKPHDNLSDLLYYL